MAFHQSSSRRAIYLDYAASTPVDPRVLKAMLPYLGGSPARHARQRAGVAGWGNPGSLHSFGQEAIAAVDHARETIAKSIGAGFREVIFTGSATEANNMALRGAVGRIMNNELGIKGGKRNNPSSIIHNSRFIIPRIIVSAIEHESVLETARDLEREGAEVVYLPVDRRGIVNLKKLEQELNDRTVLVSIMYANNEIGIVQPIAKIADLIQKFKTDTASSKTQNLKPKTYPLFHTDAVQAFQFLDCNTEELGVDFMTLSAHKIYGPKGVGALYVRNLKPITYNLKPIVTGGGQEFGLRSGTENVPSIVGFSKAVELISHSRELENKKIGNLRNYFWRELKKICPKAQLNGGTSTSSNNKQRANQRIRTFGNNSLFVDVLPNILNIYFPNNEAQYLLTKLDVNGVAVSAGSACTARSPKPSRVLSALGLPKERALRSIRVSFGRPTTKTELAHALKIFKTCLK